MLAVLALSNSPIIPALTLPLTTTPTPKAGRTRHIRATPVASQSRRTFLARSQTGGREGARDDGSEHFGELAVLVQRQGQIDETDGAELGEPAARGAGGLMLRGGADSVHRVGGEIGAAV